MKTGLHKKGACERRLGASALATEAGAVPLS